MERFLQRFLVNVIKAVPKRINRKDTHRFTQASERDVLFKPAVLVTLP
jgi:hypothetical protein